MKVNLKNIDFKSGDFVLDCGANSGDLSIELMRISPTIKYIGIEPAPQELLKMIRCNCTTDCSSARCSCQKHGLPCTQACGQCRGSGCFTLYRR